MNEAENVNLKGSRMMSDRLHGLDVLKQGLICFIDLLKFLDAKFFFLWTDIVRKSIRMMNLCKCEERLLDVGFIALMPLQS